MNENICGTCGLDKTADERKWQDYCPMCQPKG